MKRLRSLFVLALLFAALPAFSHTISVSRVYPAKEDLSFAKTVYFAPTELYGSRYISEQSAISKRLQTQLIEKMQADGKFTLVDSEKADLTFKLQFTDFSISDNGITIGSGDNVTKDEWTRNVHAELNLVVTNNNENQIIYSKGFNCSTLTDTMPKSRLPEAVNAFDYSRLVMPASSDLFDFPGNRPFAVVDSKVKENKADFKTALNLCRKMKDYQGAADIYKNLYESTNDFAAGFNYATMLQILYHFDEAEELYKKLQEVNPKDNNLKNAIKRFPEDKANYEILKSRNQVQ